MLAPSPSENPIPLERLYGEEKVMKPLEQKPKNPINSKNEGPIHAISIKLVLLTPTIGAIPAEVPGMRVKQLPR